jgi:holo-[acyl-carrier protein] synthase
MKGIGIDAVEIERFRTMLQRRPNMRTRLFTEEELTSLAGQVDDAASLAARFVKQQ